ncbi:MAG: hypothetical protein P8Z81_01905 [Deinococcales bacterium]|jgi:hypothetical protein
MNPTNGSWPARHGGAGDRGNHDRGRGARLAKAALFGLALVTYVLVIGQNWGIYAAAMMAAAYRNGQGRRRRAAGGRVAGRR